MFLRQHALNVENRQVTISSAETAEPTRRDAAAPAATFRISYTISVDSKNAAAVTRTINSALMETTLTDHLTHFGAKIAAEYQAASGAQPHTGHLLYDIVAQARLFHRTDFSLSML
jgi:hypothetical protein